MKNPSQIAEEYIKNRKMPFPIIDSHAHMGPNYGTYMSKCSTDEMIELMDKENIEMIFCAPHSALFDPGAQNRELEEAMKKYPQRIRGFFTFNPNYCKEFTSSGNRC